MKNTNKVHFLMLFSLVAQGLATTNIVAKEHNDQSQAAETRKCCNDCGRSCKCCNTSNCGKCGKNCSCGKCCNSCGKSCGCKKSQDNVEAPE